MWSSIGYVKMRKSSLFHRKTLLSTSLMASLLIFPVILIAVVPSILPASHGAPATVLAAPTIVDPTKTPPSTFYINITIADVSAMWGYQFFLYYDTKVLTATAYATYAPFNLDWNPALNDTAGFAFLAYSMKLGELVGFSTVTPKAIGRIDFSVDSLGTSKLDLVESVISDIFGNPITHTAQDGSFTNQAAVPDFSISASPTSKTIVQGGSGTSTITITSLNNFNSAVSLSITGLPTGTTGTFSPTSVTPPAGGSATSTLTINVGASTATGTYTLTVTGTGGGKTHSVQISLTVTAAPDFSISASPSSLTIVQGESGTSTITITSANGFNSAVSLSISGLPTGVTASFSPTSVTPPPDGSATSTLTINVDASTATGTYQLTVTGTSGTLEHSVTVSLTVTAPAVPDFSISASPTSLTIIRGNSGTSTITVTSLNGFSEAVSLSISGAPTGVTATLSPTSVTPPPDGSATSALTVSVDATAPTGSFTLIVTGTSGTLTHTVNIILIVQASFEVTIDTQTFIVLAVSNSTIEDFTFNQTLNQMNFTISGPPGTTGYLNVTIPKAVFPALPEQWTFLFDGSPITPTMTQNATHVFLSFTYVHSVHTITIMGGPIPLAPEVVSTDSSGNLKSNFQPSEEVWVKGTGFAADKDVTIHIIPYNTDPAQAEPGMSVANSTATTSSTGELPVTLAWSPPLTPGKYDIWVDANKNGVFDTGDAYNNVLISEYGFLVIPEPAIIVSALLMLGALATFYFTRKRKLH